jgi:hypothetical protein
VSVHVEVLDPGVEPPGGRPLDPEGAACFYLVGPSYMRAYQAREHEWHPANLDTEPTARSHVGIWYCSHCRRVERRTVTIQQYANPEDVPV